MLIMAWGFHSRYESKKAWIHTTILIFLFILTTKMTSARICESCTECNVKRECYCKVTTLYNSLQRWNNWYGRYERIQDQKLYSFLTCEHFFPDSKLANNLCNDDCKYITFRNSDIGTLKVNFFIDLSKIDEIYLNSSGISQIHIGAFSGISGLKVLHLEDNKLEKISQGQLNSLISLKILDLHRNTISLIENESFLGLTMLEDLDLSQNSMEMVHAELFHPLENLKVLNLSHNYFTGIGFDFSPLKNLDTLDLSWNKIEILDMCFKETKLTSLYLQENQISFVNDSCFPISISTIFIQGNNITSLKNGVLEDLVELKVLDVSHNDIREISVDLFKNCNHLRKLDISHNEIDYLKTGVFSGVSNLSFLNLSYTKMSTLEPHTFIPLNNLKLLDISNINLNDLDTTIFNHFTDLKKIYINGNHFSCSVVASIISHAKLNNFSVIYEKDFTSENVNGLPCRKRNTFIGMDNGNSEKKEDLFKELWEIREKEIFENIGKIVQNTIKDTMYAEEASFNNSLDEFLSKQEYMLQQFKIMMESEKVDLKKFINETYAKHSATIDESNSIHSKSIHSKIDKHFQSQNTKLEDNFMKFTTNLRTFVEKSVPNIEYSALNSFKNIFNLSNSSTSMLKNNFISDSENSTSNQIKKLSDTMDQLKILLMLICTVCILLYIFEKVSILCWKRFRNAKESFDINQELPIIRNY